MVPDFLDKDALPLVVHISTSLLFSLVSAQRIIWSQHFCIAAASSSLPSFASRSSQTLCTSCQDDILPNADEPAVITTIAPAMPIAALNLRMPGHLLFLSPSGSADAALIIGILAENMQNFNRRVCCRLRSGSRYDRVKS